jgi:hypothetical protein
MSSSADKLKKINNAFDPIRAATESQYCDLSKVRGRPSFVGYFRKRVEQAEDWLSILFTGHVGSGKSSELNALVRELDRPSEKRYFAVRIVAGDYLDPFDSDMPELLLAIVSELAHSLRDKLKIELADGYIQNRLREFWGFLNSEVKVDEIEIPLWDASVILKRMPTDPAAREEVRKAIRPKMSTFLSELNTLFAAAREKIRKHPRKYDDLVFIFDDLEKVRQFGGREEGVESQRELFLERFAQLRGLQAHFVWTVPLRLVRSKDGPQLASRYDGDPFVMPMVKIRNRDGSEYAPGVEALRDLLSARLSNAHLTAEDAFTPDAVDFLIRYSGGNVRTLCSWIQQACVQTDALPITRTEARRAVSPTVQTYSASIPESHWLKLAGVDIDPEHAIPGGDGDYLAMLENLSLLEYLNGDGVEEFQADEPWYGVNPIVRELTKYKSAIARLREGSSGT